MVCDQTVNTGEGIKGWIQQSSLRDSLLLKMPVNEKCLWWWHLMPLTW